MTPQDFVRKWKEAQLKESAAAQEHFLDLCALLQVDTPGMADPKGEWYTFEKGSVKTTGAPGFADVWKRGCFGWEYKGPGGNLQEAYAQLQRYAPAWKIRRFSSFPICAASTFTPTGPIPFISASN